MVEISFVEPGSIAEELELHAGDKIVSINGHVVRDLLDFQLLVYQEEIILEVRAKEGDEWEVELEKDAPDDMGIHLEHPEPTQCGNNCIFCFVHQLPPGMRRSLYVKDEDYRYSFMYGSYVTLTNIGEEEIDRIITQKLSPLYVSVHATDDQLRATLLGRDAPSILELLKRLVDGGIEIHTQIVVCPGFNDGAQLQRTIEDLRVLYPGVRSLAVVPVGLTGYRSRLPELRPLTKSESRAILEMLDIFGREYRREIGTRFVYAADEFYLKADVDFPPLSDYDDLFQLENGVGMIPGFREEAEEVLAEAELLDLKSVSTFTGVSSFVDIDRFLNRLSVKTGVPIRTHPINNIFFGGHVTVTGLLTGKDVIEQLKGHDLGEILLVPDVVFREGEDVFLDDVTLEELGKSLKVKVIKIRSTPWGILEGLESFKA